MGERVGILLPVWAWLLVGWLALTIWFLRRNTNDLGAFLLWVCVTVGIVAFVLGRML